MWGGGIELRVRERMLAVHATSLLEVNEDFIRKLSCK